MADDIVARPARKHLGMGSHEVPGSDNAKQAARNMFLEKVAEHAPGVLAALKEEPYREFREALEKKYGSQANAVHATIYETFVRRLVETLPTPPIPALEDLPLPILDGWSKRWHLDADWARRCARLTMQDWWDQESNLGSTSDWGWRGEGWLATDPIDVDELGFVPVLPSWIPWHQTWAEAAAEIYKVLDAQLDSYRARVEHLCDEHGVRVKAEKRNWEHFDWLARFQCAEAEAIDIAEELYAARLAKLATRRKDAQRDLISVKSAVEVAKTARNLATGPGPIAEAHQAYLDVFAAYGKHNRAANAAKKAHLEAKAKVVTESSTVRDAIDKIATLIELTPRQARIGRPQGE